MFGAIKRWFTGEPAPEGEGGGGGGASGGFAVQKAVAVERTPVLNSPGYRTPAGVQGLGWFMRLLRVDADGDTAEEFLEESADGGLRACAASEGARSVSSTEPVAIANGDVIVR